MTTQNCINATPPFSLANGGTNNGSLTASAGGVVWTDSSKMNVLAGTATASQMLQSGNAATPAWSTATWPATTTVNQILYASSSNVVGGLSTTNSAVMATTSGGAPQWLALTDGQVAIGSSTGAPLAATLTAGTNISVTNGHNTITIAATGAGGFVWTDVTGTSQTMAANNGYIADNASLVTLTLPTTSAQGTIIEISGNGAGGWTVAQNSGQAIKFGSVTTTTGTGGSLSSSNRYDAIKLLCTVANTQWNVQSSVGNITYV